MPVVSGVGRAAWHSSRAKCPSPGPRHALAQCPQLGSREAPGRPGVTEEEGLKEEERQRRKSWRGQKTEVPWTGRGCRERQTEETAWMEATPGIRGKGEQGIMPAPSPLPRAGSPCLPEGAGGRGGGGRRILENFASYSKPAQGQSPKADQHPVLCGEVHIDAWVMHLPKGHGDSERHKHTPSDSSYEKVPKSFHFALPHSPSPCQLSGESESPPLRLT